MLYKACKYKAKVYANRDRDNKTYSAVTKYICCIAPKLSAKPTEVNVFSVFFLFSSNKSHA